MDENIQAWIDAVDYASGFISRHGGNETDRLKYLHELNHWLIEHIDRISQMMTEDELLNEISRDFDAPDEL